MSTEEATPPNGTDSRPVRYVLESDYGLLVNVTEDLGDHLLLWTSREGAERMCPAFAGVGRYWVASIESDELRDELTAMRDDGMRFVLLDSMPDAEGQKLPIDEAIAFYTSLAGPPHEFLSATDHFIQRLERYRKTDAKVDADAEAMPVDCPVCKQYFTLPEMRYRDWRDGRVEMIRCPKCQACFRESKFDRVKCVDLHPTLPCVLIALYAGSVTIYDWNTQTQVRSLEITNAPVRSAKFIPRKQWIIVGADDTFLRVFNFNTAEKIKTIEDHTDYIRHIAVHPTMPYVISCSDDDTIKMFDWDKKWTRVNTFLDHDHYVM